MKTETRFEVWKLSPDGNLHYWWGDYTTREMAEKSIDGSKDNLVVVNVTRTVISDCPRTRFVWESLETL